MLSHFSKSFFLILCCFFCIFTSCNQNETEILSTTGTLIFEYDENSTIPKTRLSVFVNTKNEAVRSQKIEVKGPKDNLKWILEDLVFIKSNNRQWAGYPKLFMNENSNFSGGRYVVKLTDLQDTEAESAFILTFNEELLLCPKEEIFDKVNGKLNKNIVLYDKDENLIYYGAKRNTWRTSKNIKRDYNKTEFLRKCWSNSTGSLLFLYPLEKVNDSETENLLK